MDLEKCLKNNIHNRSEADIRDALDEWTPTPHAYTVLDYSFLFHSADNTEEVSDVDDEKEAGSLDAVSDEDNTNADKNIDDEFSDGDGDDQLINEVRILYVFFVSNSNTTFGPFPNSISPESHHVVLL